MGKSIFKFADKFGYESPFGDWLEEKKLKNNVDEEPPKILDVEVNRNMLEYLKISVIVSVKVTKKNFGKVTIKHEGKSKTGKQNILAQTYEAEFDIEMKEPFYKNCLFEIELRDSRNNIVETRSKLSQVRRHPILYETREECLCKKKYLTSVDLEYLVSRLRQVDLTAKIPVKNTVGSNRNWLYLDQNGDIIESKPNGKKPDGSSGKYEIQQSKYDELTNKIFHSNYKEKIRKGENNFKVFAQHLSQTFVKYKINTCIRKIHFMAQVYVETDEFKATYEKGFSSSVSGGGFYRGRGLKQITHDYNYLEYYDYVHKTSHFKVYMRYSKYSKENGRENFKAFNTRTNNKYISIADMKKINGFVPKLATSMKYACDAAGWYWNKNNINFYADKDDIAAVSALVNNPYALKGKKANESINTSSINGYPKREKYYKLLKQFLTMKIAVKVIISIISLFYLLQCSSNILQKTNQIYINDVSNISIIDYTKDTLYYIFNEFGNDNQFMITYTLWLEDSCFGAYNDKNWETIHKYRAENLDAGEVSVTYHIDYIESNTVTNLLNISNAMFNGQVRLEVGDEGEFKNTYKGIHFLRIIIIPYVGNFSQLSLNYGLDENEDWIYLYRERMHLKSYPNDTRTVGYCLDTLSEFYGDNVDWYEVTSESGWSYAKCNE